MSGCPFCWTIWFTRAAAVLVKAATAESSPLEYAFVYRPTGT